MAYAHAVIEIGDTKIPRGAEVPADVAGYDDLVAGGAIKEEAYVPPTAAELAPDVIAGPDGVMYRRIEANDGADSGEVSA